MLHMCRCPLRLESLQQQKKPINFGLKQTHKHTNKSNGSHKNHRRPTFTSRMRFPLPLYLLHVCLEPEPTGLPPETMTYIDIVRWPVVFLKQAHKNTQTCTRFTRLRDLPWRTSTVCIIHSSSSPRPSWPALNTFKVFKTTTTTTTNAKRPKHSPISGTDVRFLCTMIGQRGFWPMPVVTPVKNGRLPLIWTTPGSQSLPGAA